MVSWVLVCFRGYVFTVGLLTFVLRVGLGWLGALTGTVLGSMVGLGNTPVVGYSLAGFLLGVGLQLGFAVRVRWTYLSISFRNASLWAVVWWIRLRLVVLSWLTLMTSTAGTFVLRTRRWFAALMRLLRGATTGRLAIRNGPVGLLGRVRRTLLGPAVGTWTGRMVSGRVGLGPSAVTLLATYVVP